MPRSDQGVFPQRYSLIPRTLIFVTCGNEVLLIKGAPSKRLWANRYNGIGGHIERGEDVLSAARREFLEETGSPPPDLRLVGTVTIDTGEALGICLFVLRGELFVAEKANLQLDHRSEEGTLEWVSASGMASLPLVEDLHTLLPKVLEHRVSDPPFAAHYSYDENERLIIRMAE